MGTAGAGAGFIFFLFFALLGGIIFLALGIYRRHYLRQKTDPSSLRILLLNSTMTIAITPILLLLTGILVHSIGRFFIEKSQLETDKQRYRSLSSALPFGEIIIPKDSWINSTGTVEYPFENFKDIRQGLYKARLSTPIEIANFPTAAFEVTYRGVLLELAQTYAYKLKAIEHTCKKGWLIDLRYR